MSETTDKRDIHELAGGWITERKGTPVPGFLKLTYVGFCAFGLIYLFRYMTGEVEHATRGPLVKQLNAVMDQPGTPWFALLGTLIAAYTALLLWYALVRKEEE